MDQDPSAIIDVGSNSVRLVVYAGAPRVPFPIFNEKVMAGLGKRLGETGELSEGAQARALAALARFRILIDEMEVGQVRVVATAAVREARNGEAFLDRVRALQFEPEILSGKEEAIAAGLGVISGMPDADGIVADLGGGSLELVDVANGEIRDRVSLPLGVLRIGPSLKNRPALTKTIAGAITDAGFAGRASKRPLYLVGGSWRALARLDMAEIEYPLPIMHHYAMRSERPEELDAVIAALDDDRLEAIQGLQPSRVAALPAANLLLQILVKELRPSGLVVSSFGIREGLIYEDLDRAMRARDPLIEAAREAGRGLGRFNQHGSLLDRWIAPLFVDDDADAARLRLASCLLADVAWQAHPDFRAERGVDMALHGNWVGIDGPGRVMIAQALFANFGGEGDFADSAVAALCSPDELQRARLWGLAMRLGQRLSGGVAFALERTGLAFVGDCLRLTLEGEDEALYGETVERRLKALAGALGRQYELMLV